MDLRCGNKCPHGQDQMRGAFLSERSPGRECGLYNGDELKKN